MTTDSAHTNASDPSDAELEADLDALAAVRSANFNPGGRVPGEVTVGAAIARAGDRAVPRLRTIAANGDPHARVHATSMLLHMAREHGLDALRAMLADPTPVNISYCLRGYRRLDEWAADQLAAYTRAQSPIPPTAGWWSRLRAWARR